MLLPDHKFAFIDECGNFGYDFTKEGTSHYFMVCAVIVDPRNVESLTELVRSQLVQGGELKSKTIGRDHPRRFRIIKSLLEIPFYVLYVVIDKKKVYPHTGLGWKQSFIKYAHQRLHRALAKPFKSLDITSDEYGTAEFMKGFERYIAKKSGSLFNFYTFKFDKSKGNELLQLADFIGGTIFMGFEEKVPEHYNAYLKYLQDKIIYSEVFPEKYENYLVEEDFQIPEFDRRIANSCVDLAARYINEHEFDDDLWEVNRVYTLNRLLFQLKVDPAAYLNTPQLKQMVNDYTGYSGSEQEFRAEVIGKLRDRGIIIASSDKGYKIPLTVNEAYSHCNRVVQVINPMLARLQKFRSGILLATRNELDILDQPEYQNMRVYFDLLERRVQ